MLLDGHVKFVKFECSMSSSDVRSVDGGHG
jgi:hypothetical protein